MAAALRPVAASKTPFSGEAERQTRVCLFVVDATLMVRIVTTLIG